MQQPNSISPQTIATIQEICIAEYPKEACGVVENRKVIIGKNIAKQPERDFALDPNIWGKVKKADFIWHSHCNDTDLSFADIETCKAIKIPMYLFSLPIGLEYYYDPITIQPLIGRKFVYWAADCWTVIADWYKLELGIELQDHPRELKNEEGLYYWDQPDWDAYQQDLPISFDRLQPGTPLERGDVILMTMRWNSPPGIETPNHVAVVDNAEKSEVIHHLLDQLSKRDIYGDEFRRLTHSVWRYRNTKKL
jgi:proteasome lid subunit RPN8/RPN11